MRQKLKSQYPYMTEMEIDNILQVIQEEDVTLEEAVQLTTAHDLP